jgi:hypothetical protein
VQALVQVSRYRGRKNLAISYLALKKTEHPYIFTVSDFFVVINNYARPEWHQYNDIV